MVTNSASAPLYESDSAGKTPDVPNIIYKASLESLDAFSNPQVNSLKGEQLDALLY